MYRPFAPTLYTSLRGATARRPDAHRHTYRCISSGLSHDPWPPESLWVLPADISCQLHGHGPHDARPCSMLAALVYTRIARTHPMSTQPPLARSAAGTHSHAVHRRTVPLSRAPTRVHSHSRPRVARFASRPHCSSQSTHHRPSLVHGLDPRRVGGRHHTCTPSLPAAHAGRSDTRRTHQCRSAGCLGRPTRAKQSACRRAQRGPAVLARHLAGRGCARRGRSRVGARGARALSPSSSS